MTTYFDARGAFEQALTEIDKLRAENIKLKISLAKTDLIVGTLIAYLQNELGNAAAGSLLKQLNAKDDQQRSVGG